MSKNKTKNKSKKIQKNKVTQQVKKEMVIAFYKRNLDVFVERELGVKLNWWQRFILKHMRLKNGK